jgi:hypothetical protein
MGLEAHIVVAFPPPDVVHRSDCPERRDMTPDVMRRFNELNLSDCRLMAAALEPGPAEERDVIRLALDMVAGAHADEWRPAQLLFHNCAAIRFHIDTFFKRSVSDTISGTSCELAWEVRDDIMLEHSPFREKFQPTDEMILFRVALCPPSGELLIVARDFTFEYSTPGE